MKIEGEVISIIQTSKGITEGCGIRISWYGGSTEIFVTHAQAKSYWIGRRVSIEVKPK